MKNPLVRTKVVIRHLPPTLSHSALFEQIDGRFAGRYKWFYFRPGKNSSQKHQKYSRAYIDFRRPEDVVEFAEFFDGHVFVNEKGTQVKAMVEYSPSQRVPKSWCKKDGREGTILKDAEYLEFLELLAKPVENLPSAEIQLEKREAERVGAGKEPPIITPLMDFVRQKRAAKGGIQRLSSNGKLNRRAMGASPGNSRSTSSKQGSEKRRTSTSVYVKRDSTKSTSGKEKSTYISASDKSNSPNTEVAADMIMDESGASGAIDLGKKKVLLLKGKEQEISHSVTSVRNSAGYPAIRNSQRREVGGGGIRSILSNKEARQSQSSKVVHTEPQIQTLEKEKKPPRSTNIPLILKNHLSSFSVTAFNSDGDVKRIADVGGESQGSGSINEKQDKRTRNKDRPDRSVWSHRRSNGSHGSDETLSLSESLEGISITHQSHPPGVGKGENTTDSGGKHRSFMSSQLDIKTDVPISTRSVEVRTVGSIRSGSSLENGAYRHGRRGIAHMKDDGSLYVSDGKLPKRGGATGYGPHEKQVWVQKSGSGT